MQREVKLEIILGRRKSIIGYVNAEDGGPKFSVILSVGL
jgi:hypothetical protein